MRFESQADGMPPSVVAENSLGGRPQPVKDYLARRSPADRRDVSTVVPRSGPDEVHDAVRAVEQSAEESVWMSAARDSGWLLRMATLLEQHQGELAGFGARELGQPYKELVADVLGARSALRWLYATSTLDTRLCLDDSQELELFARQRDSAAAVINCACAVDPASSALTRVAAALARGCATLLRPQPESAGITTLLLELLRQAGAPLHKLCVVHGGQETESLLLEGVRTRGWVLLGQGTSVASHVPGRASPAIVLADADLRLAIPAIVMMATRASGQSDDACHHVIADRRIVGHVRDELTRRLAKTIPSNPMSPETEMGPMLSEPMLHAWNELRSLGIGEGAELLVDGVRFDAPVADRVSSQGSVALNATPRLFARVTRAMQLCSSPTRGPTLLILEADGIGEALELTGSLGSLENLSLFSRDARVFSAFRGHRQAAAILSNPSTSLVLAANRRAQMAALDAWERCGHWQLVVHDSGDHASDAEALKHGTEDEKTLAWPALQKQSS